MPEIDEDDDLLNPDEGDSKAMRAVRQALREAKRREKELDAKLAQVEADAKRAGALERDNALLRAGVPSDTPLGKVFAKAYDGELTLEAIKAAWTELSPGGSNPPPAQQNGTSAPDLNGELARADKMASASPTGFDPGREAAYEAERAAAKSAPELIAVLTKYGKLADPVVD